MKVNILPSILKGEGGRDKGGTEKEGGRTGRGDIQAVVGGWSLSIGAQCLRALVIRGWGHRHLRGISIVQSGGSSSSVGMAMPVLCRQGVVGVV
jgi:hypothetical protein